MRVSIALCTFNGADFLGEQLESIGSQSEPPHEVVIVDDGSTDATVGIASMFAAEAPFPVSVATNAERLGPGANFGRAIARCTGNWIVLSDQDDVWRPERLALLRRAVNERPDADAIFTDADLVDQHLRPAGKRLWKSFGFTDALRRRLDGNALDVLLERPVVTGATLAIRADIRWLVLPIPSEWIHDMWISLLVAAAGRLVAHPDAPVLYRLHGGNTIGVASRGLGARTARAHGTLRQQFAWQCERFAELRQRLLDSGLPRADALAKLDAKLAHLGVRAGLKRNRFRRVGPVARELLAGRYARFSSGALSAARDLILP